MLEAIVKEILVRNFSRLLIKSWIRKVMQFGFKRSEGAKRICKTKQNSFTQSIPPQTAPLSQLPLNKTFVYLAIS